MPEPLGGLDLEQKGLGDAIRQALAVLGITPERVERFWANCQCEDRRERLNQLGWWARRVLRGHVERAREYLDRIIGDAFAND
jgi:hypothetical protein